MSYHEYALIGLTVILFWMVFFRLIKIDPIDAFFMAFIIGFGSIGILFILYWICAGIGFVVGSVLV